MMYTLVHLLWTSCMLCMATGMRENAHAGSIYNLNISVNASEHLDTVAAVAAEAAHRGFPDDPFKDDPWFKERRDPNHDPFKDNSFFNKNRNGGHNGFNNGGNNGGNRFPDADSSPAGTPHHYPKPSREVVAAGGLFAGFGLVILCTWCSCFCCIVGCPCLLLCRGHFKARALREKLENLQLKHPAHGERKPVAALSDGMMRLAQENRIIIKEHVNVAQELSGHVLGYSIQTANSFDVVSVTGGGEHVLSCREVQDLKAMLGMNMAAGLQAMGVDGAGAWAGRDKAPFRMLVGLPQAPDPMKTGKMEVVIPEGVVSGQMIQVTAPSGEQFTVAVPPGIAPGQKMEVQLPGVQSGPGMQEVMTGLVPGCAPNSDQPFLYLDRPFAVDCCCINRPKVDVFDVRGSLTVKLGIISDPFAWLDMTFGIHVGPNASESDPPTLVARGAACQPGTPCKLCGLCCGRTCQEVYLEVVDPNDGDRTVAFITKGWAGGMKELFTSANSFYVDFGEVKDPACKGLLLATALFLNYRFFEGKAGSTGVSSD